MPNSAKSKMLLHILQLSSLSYHQPSYTVAQPSYTVAQPSYTVAQPSYTVTQPLVQAAHVVQAAPIVQAAPVVHAAPVIAKPAATSYSSFQQVPNINTNFFFH